MIKRAVDTVLMLVSDVMLIGNQSEVYAGLGLPVHADAVERCGPLGGIYTALLHAKFQQCLVLACDLPFLSGSLLQFLCENCAACDVLVFESDSGLEPLCAVYSKRCLSVIQENIKNKYYKVSDFHEKVNTHIVRLNPDQPFYDSKAFININTKDDLRQARKLLNKK